MGMLITALTLYPVFSQSDSLRRITAQQTANVRETPSTSAARVATLNVGDTAVVIGEDATGEAVQGNSLWYQVRLPNGATGWVWSGVVTLAEVTPTPSPTPRPTLPPNPDYETITVENAQQLEMAYEWGQGVISRLAWSPDGDHLLVGSTRGLWQYDTANLSAGAELIYPLSTEGDNLTLMTQMGIVGDTSNVWYMGLIGDEIKIQLVNLATGERGTTLRSEDSYGSAYSSAISYGMPLQRAALSPDGYLFAVAGNDTVRLVQLLYNSPTETIRRQDEQATLSIPFLVGYVAFSPDGTKLAVSGNTAYSGNNKTQVYSVPDLTLLATINDAGPLLFSADSARLIVGYVNYTVFNLVENQQERLVQTPLDMGLITQAALSPTADQLAVGYRFLNHGVYFYDMARGEALGSLPAATTYSALAYHPDGSQLAAISLSSGTLTIWDTASGEVLLNDLYSAGPSALQLDASGAVLAQQRGDQVALYDPRDPTGAIQSQFTLPAWHIVGLSLLSPQADRVLASGALSVGNSWENRLQLLDIQGNPLADEINVDTLVSGGIASSSYTSFAYHPDGTFIAVGDVNGNITLRDPLTWQQQLSFSQNGEAAGQMVFSADGQVLVASGKNRHVWVWRSDGTLVSILTMPTNNPYDDAQSLSISADGGRVAAADGDKVYVFDTTTGELLWTMARSNHQSVWRAVLSPDGSLLAAVTYDGELFVYGVEHHRLLKSFPISQRTNSLTFSPDGSLLLAVGQDGIVRFWGVAREDVPSTSTATPTPRPTTTTEVLFFDDFSDGDLAGWDLSYASDAAEVIEVEGNQVLHVTGAQTDYISLGFTDVSRRAKVLEADLQFVGNDDSSEGMVNFNLVSELPGHGKGYSAVIFLPASGISLADRYNNFQPLNPTINTPFTIQRGAWIHIRFELVEDVLSLYLDEVLVQQAEVNPMRFGVPLFILERGLEVYLDNVKVE